MRQFLSKTLMLVLLTSFLLVPCFAAQGVPPLGVVKAAETGLKAFVEPEPGLRELGSGFQVHTITPRTLIDNTNLTLEAMIEPTNMWRFMVVRNGVPAGLLTVVLMNGHWRAVSFGGAELALEMAGIETAWPGKDGYDFRFVRVYQAVADLMEIRKGPDTQGFAPLRSAKMALAMDGFALTASTLLHDSEILAPLRERVMANISADLDRGGREH